MIKITTTALVAAAMLIVSCCAGGGSHTGKTACADLATLNLTPDQKAKIEVWQAECMKAGCTKESRQTFFSRAKEILSAGQFAQLKAQCKKTAGATKTQT